MHISLFSNIKILIFIYYTFMIEHYKNYNYCYYTKKKLIFCIMDQKEILIIKIINQSNQFIVYQIKTSI